jgi:hypothetical protein
MSIPVIGELKSGTSATPLKRVKKKSRSGFPVLKVGGATIDLGFCNCRV